MKTLSRLTGLLLASLVTVNAQVTKITPSAAAQLVAEGKAVLVDVREPSEWAETGVAAPAMLLPKSEFDAGMTGAWKDFIKQVGDKQVITYCRSGRRSDAVAAALAEKGLKVANAGGFNAWQEAGLPVRKAAEPTKKP